MSNPLIIETNKDISKRIKCSRSAQYSLMTPSNLPYHGASLFDRFSLYEATGEMKQEKCTFTLLIFLRF